MVGKNYGSLWIETEKRQFPYKVSTPMRCVAPMDVVLCLSRQERRKRTGYPVFFLYLLAPKTNSYSVSRKKKQRNKNIIIFRIYIIFQYSEYCPNIPRIYHNPVLLDFKRLQRRQEATRFSLSFTPFGSFFCQYLFRFA